MYQCQINGKTAKEFLYLNVLTAYLFTLVLDLTALEANAAFVTAMQYIRYACYLVALLMILIDAYNGKSIVILGVVIILVVLMIVYSNAREYLFYLLMIIAAKDVCFTNIIKRACFVQGAVLAVFVLGSQMGVVENYLFSPTVRERYGMGFTWTTTSSILFFFFVMCWLYLRRDRMKLYEFGILEAINVWLFIKTDSRLSFYLSTAMLIYVFLMRYFWQNRKDKIRKNRWLILTPAACCVGGILLHALYNPNNEMWAALNNLLSDRLALGRDALDTYGITLFGQPITWVGYDRLASGGVYNYVDCSYVQILLQCGVIFLILIIAAYTFMMYTAVKNKDFYLQTILLFIVVFSITEPRLMNLQFNPFPFFAATVWGVRSLQRLREKDFVFLWNVRFRSTQIKLKNRC